MRGIIIGTAGLALLGASLLTRMQNGALAGPFPPGELAAAGALMLLYWGLYRSEQASDRTLSQKIRQLGLYTVLFSIGTALVQREYTASVPWSMPVPNLPPGAVWYLVFAAVAYTAVKMLVLLRSLIFIEQGQRTFGNFILLIVIMALRIVQAHFNFEAGDGSFAFTWGNEFQFNNPTGPLTVLFLLLLFINGFRCKWIHYLNRNQKIGIFFAGILVNGVAGATMPSLGLAMSQFSVTAGIFIRDVHTFFFIYSGMALLGLLFQLPSAGIMDRRMRQIRSLQNLSADLGSVLDRRELLSKSCLLAGAMVEGEVSWIELKAQNNCRVSMSAGLSCQDIEELPANLRQNIRELAETCDTALLINNVPKDPAVRRLSADTVRAGSLLAAPVTFKETLLGYIYTVTRRRFGFAEESRGLFKAFADQIGVALENSRLAQVSIEQGVYKEELKMAHDAQMRLLPQKMPVIEGIDLDAFCLTANEIGGDFYDIIRISPERTDIVIGDVSGKGASAAFYMAEIKGLVQALAFHHNCPVEILTEINGFIKARFEADTFVTMIYSVLLHKQGKLIIARAGHPPVALVRNKQVEWLEPDGLGLGLATNEVINRILKKQELSLVRGDTVVYLTDGLIEARDRTGDEYGEQRLAEALPAFGELQAAGVSAGIRRSMQEFIGDVPRHDDVTVLTLRIPEDTRNDKERI